MPRLRTSPLGYSRRKSRDCKHAAHLGERHSQLLTRTVFASLARQVIVGTHGATLPRLHPALATRISVEGAPSGDRLGRRTYKQRTEGRYLVISHGYETGGLLPL